MHALLLSSIWITDPGESVRPFRLEPGRELVYRGLRTEAPIDGSERNFELECRLFVLDDASVALFSAARPVTGQPLIRLDLAVMPSPGRLQWREGLTPAGPDWKPEPDVVVELPPGPCEVGSMFTICSPGDPARNWVVENWESVLGVRCLKLVGRSQSAHWDQVGGGEARRCDDQVWLAPATGLVMKRQTVLHRRDPGQARAHSRLEIHLEFESDLTYPNHLGAERGREIRQVLAFAGQLERAAARPGPPAIAAVQTRIDWHTRHMPATPYRPALLTLQRRLEAIRRGEAAPTVGRD